MDINDFWKVCINLESRPDRWKESEKEFTKAGLNVEQFKVVPNLNPVVGCANSHFEILKVALELDRHVMIFEDDVHFVNNYKDLPEYLNELETLDWGILYFGANITQHIKVVSDKLAQVFHAQSTHAYCVNKKFIPIVLEYKHLLGKHMDLIYAENVIPRGKCYITRPMLAIQRPTFSDIEKKMVNYNWMEDRYNEHLVRKELE